MRVRLEIGLRLCLCASLAISGCALRPGSDFVADAELEHYKTAATQLEYPDVETAGLFDSGLLAAPLTLADAEAPEYWALTLNDALQLALQNSQAMRDLGGLVITAPQAVRTVLDPALAETDPRFGTSAALSAFDASFESSFFFEKNDRALNNVFFGGGTRMFVQDLHAYTTEISKTAATGTDFSMRQIIDYDHNNSPGNDDPNRPWTIQVESEVRQPLLQGAGVDFNRIAGPRGAPGAINGVLVARIQTDISLADFELGVRNLVSDVENTYWELYFAYRDLDAKIAARDRALETWRRIHALFVTERRGGETEKEAQAREQYFRLEEEVQNALAGRAQDRVRTMVFRGTGGVHGNERRLRMLLGVSLSDGRLIRPADEPVMAKVMFSWDEILAEALLRRPELRRQKWQVKRNELQLVASRNFLLPRVDAVARYRFRGLGRHLVNPTRQPSRFNNAVQDLTTGDWQEWMLGMEVSFPFGYRQANAAVRNAELQLIRSRAILEEQERFVSLELSDAVAEVERAYLTAQTNYNRRLAGQQQLAALESNYEVADQNEKTRLLDLLLESQRRLAEAEANYYRTLVEYTLAIKSVHLSKGSLLEYNQVYLSEGPWPEKAYGDADHRERHRHDPPQLLQRLFSRPASISQGGVAQRLAPAHVAEPPLAQPASIESTATGSTDNSQGNARPAVDPPEQTAADAGRVTGGDIRAEPQEHGDASLGWEASPAEMASPAAAVDPAFSRLPRVTLNAARDVSDRWGGIGRATFSPTTDRHWPAAHQPPVDARPRFQPFSPFEQLGP